MLTKNSLLEEITQKLAGAGPNWPEVVKRFKESKLFRKRNYKGKPNFYSKLSEIHLRESLERICGVYNGHIKFDSIKPLESTKNFTFNLHPHGNLRVQRNDDWNEHTEYDELLVVDGLPVLFEVKLQRPRSSSFTNGLGSSNGISNGTRKVINGMPSSPSSLGTNHALRPGRLSYLLAPIREYFGKEECGYVLVIPPENTMTTSPYRQAFLEQNGILVPFYTGRKEFRVEVDKIKGEYGI